MACAASQRATSPNAGWSSTLTAEPPTGDQPPDAAPEPPADALAIFGARLPLVRRYADLLAGDAVVRGLVGPRETVRLWDRHILNCAVLGELLPVGTRIVDVGSGAGLPGLVLACLRPDVTVDLIDSLHRRTEFLVDAVSILELEDRVRVVTGRAEDPTVSAHVGGASWVTARAVAPLHRLIAWCLPLMAVGGTLLAVKGARAAAEITEYRAQAGRRDAPRTQRVALSVIQCGVGRITDPTSVVRVVRLT